MSSGCNRGCRLGVEESVAARCLRNGLSSDPSAPMGAGTRDRVEPPVTDVSEQGLGDESAPSERFAALFAKEYEGLVRLAYLMSGLGQSSLVAEEIVQEAFADAYRRGLIGCNGAYVRRAVVNGCRDHTRRLLRWRQRMPKLVFPQTEAAPVADRIDIERALRALSANQRAAVVLRYYLDLTTQEIAETLRVPPGTAKSLIHRGIERLRKDLGDSLS
jgi:RNA polymerase sigma factor (sigma-70 family)